MARRRDTPTKGGTPGDDSEKKWQAEEKRSDREKEGGTGRKRGRIPEGSPRDDAIHSTDEGGRTHVSPVPPLPILFLFCPPLPFSQSLVRRPLRDGSYYLLTLQMR